MFGFVNFCKAYGIPEEFAGQIPCPVNENAQIAAKINAIDLCDSALMTIRQIRDSFYNAPVDSDPDRAVYMTGARNRLKRATQMLDSVIWDTSFLDPTTETVLTSKRTGEKIEIERYGVDDYCANWIQSDYSVRGTFSQIMEELNDE